MVPRPFPTRRVATLALASGQPITMAGSKLAQLQSEYTYEASNLGP